MSSPRSRPGPARTVTHEPVAGGLTNTNHRVVVDGVPYFVRIPGPSTELLAVDRANERHNTLAAATTGVSPRVVAVVEAWDVFALEWVDAADDVGRGAPRAGDAGPDRRRRSADSMPVHGSATTSTCSG